MESKLDISLHGSSLNIVRRCGPALSDVINSKFGCVATFNGVDFESDPSIAQLKKPTVVPQKRLSVTLNAGVKVSVWKADLTNFQVDAVVNAANTNLRHCGGLALSLSKAGGPQIQQDSDNYIRKCGDLKTGQAIVSDHGFLPCKKIIHAVGPELDKYYPDVARAEPLLKKVIRSILDQVEKNHLKTVAIPAISSGLFNYPLPQCADTIVSVVKHYCETQSSKIEEIQLVNNDEPTVKEMERAFHQILAPRTSMTYSQAAGSKSTGAYKTSTPTVKIGNVLLTLKKGKIEEQKTDVIVNTISRDRSLKNGAISNALLEKAGPEMQKEIRLASMNGYVITTKGYKLQCKEVYHTCCFENRKDMMQEVLFKSVLDCLWKAAVSQCKSIAFPAIGTGGLGLERKDVALKMSEAVADFAQRSMDMMEVNFVIYPSDNDTFKAFEEQMICLQQKASHANSTHAMEHRDYFQDIRPPTPQISLIGSSEATQEADQWLSSLLYKFPGIIHIYNNFIQHFGDQEYQQLSRLTKNGVSIEESFVKGRASISVTGNSYEDVVVAGLQVEAMLCNIQRDFVTEEEKNMFLMSTEKVSFERKPENHSVPMFSDLVYDFKHHGLQVLKFERVRNPTLETLFELKKEQLKCSSSQKMFQRIPAQFCEMVCNIGFHAEYAPPEDTAYGEGIYFAGKVKEAMEMWKWQNEKYLYFVLAEVLTGNSTLGKPGLILPPPVGKNPKIMYDSVRGKSDITVIFSSYQALPKYIITCKMI